MTQIWRRIERKLSGHVSFRLLWVWPTTIYGFNAMHVAVNIYTRRWGYVCFHPPMRCFGGWWPWYFYISPNATPWAATFAVGPGVSPDDKHRATLRRRGVLTEEGR